MNNFTIFDYSIKNNNLKSNHYYGDTVRVFFLVASIMMLFFLPFLLLVIPAPYYMTILAVIILNIFSGLTNPMQIWISIFDGLISLIGVSVFGYYSIDAYLNLSITSLYFWINQFLAILFLLALYFSVKTIRGFLQSNKIS